MSDNRGQGATLQSNPPINITVTSSVVPIRIGMPYQAPYLITNLSAVSTVWVGTDSSVRSGNGMQIPPGGFLTRNVPGELWACLDSASTVAAQIVLDVTSSNWGGNPAAIATAILNSGVILTDNPVTLLSTAITSGTLGPIDVSTFQTIILSTVPSGVIGTNRTVYLEWQSSAGVILAQEQWAWVVGDTQIVRTSLPIKGNVLFITVSGGGANSQSVTVVGSHRPFDAYMNVPFDRTLASASNSVLGSGATLPAATLIRYDGPAFITGSLIGTVAGDAVAVIVDDLVTGRELFFTMAANVAGVGTGHCTVNSPFNINRNSWSARLINQTAAARDARLQITATPLGV
jgi:hypothetical protein